MVVNHGIKNDRCHRENGPAIVNENKDNGSNTYVLFGIKFHKNKRKFKKALKALQKIKKEVAFYPESSTKEELDTIIENFKEIYDR